MDLENPTNAETLKSSHYPADMAIDTSSSYLKPFSSAASSPGGYFFSCPASPVHYVLSSPPYSSAAPVVPPAAYEAFAPGPFEFDDLSPAGTMTSADELFLNGKIRPMKLSFSSSHLLSPQPLAPLLDLDDDEEGEAEEEEEEDGRVRELRSMSRSVHRRTRSMSPLRSPRFRWQRDEDVDKKEAAKRLEVLDPVHLKEPAATPAESSSSSLRSSSSGSRNSKGWIFLKDLLYRSKSEGSGRGNGNGKEKAKLLHSTSFSQSEESGRGNGKEKAKAKFLHSMSLSLSSSKSRLSFPLSPSSSPPSSLASKTRSSKKPTSGVGRRRSGAAAAPSAHERHYTANRAQAEEMRRRTFLPYRQGLLSCLGFTSRTYSSFHGLAKSLNPVSSR